MVAGHHGLDELPAEITTPGPGQIRALVINSGNPVVSGPRRSQTGRALEQLDLLVVIDFVQRESHRHAHWLLPAVHWLERNDLPAIASGLHDEPYVHYGAQGGRAAAGSPRGVASLRRPGAGDEAAAVRLSGDERIRPRHPQTRDADWQNRSRVHAALDRQAVGGHRPQDQVARHHGPPTRLGLRPARIRPFQERA